MSLSVENKTETTVQVTVYPLLVQKEAYKISKRIVARLNGQTPVSNNTFLGYCSVHKQYYLDHKHTNDVIRCPICDHEWLSKRSLLTI